VQEVWYSIFGITKCFIQKTNGLYNSQSLQDWVEQEDRVRGMSVIKNQSKHQVQLYSFISGTNAQSTNAQTYLIG